MIYATIYWTSTILLSLLYLASATLYIRTPEVARAGQSALGYSAPHLIPLMIVVKILGPLAIVSRASVALSDLAYAGFFYHLSLSILAHLGVRSVKGAFPAIIGLILLIASFATQNLARAAQSPYAPHLLPF